MRRPTRCARIAPLLLLVAAGACRDGVAPYAFVLRDPLQGESLRLTWNEGDDLNPAWSKNSDTVYYTGVPFIDYPRQPASLLGLPRTGGVAHLLAPDAQKSAPQTLMLPAVSPRGDRVAYVQIGFLNSPALCQFCDVAEPLLDIGTVRVRSANANAPAGFDPGAVLHFQGVDPGRVEYRGGPYEQKAFPFQVAFRNGELLFRVTWSPDGEQVAFSDGLSLFTWGGSESQQPTPIPNTADGLSPAWSPDGSVIAFTRVVRGDSTRVSCACAEDPFQTVLDTHLRWTYTITKSAITLIHPDGSAATEIAMGSEPAWSPDGNTLYFVRDNQVMRISRSGGDPVPIPGTDGAHSPSVSPDGRWLAFTKRTPVKTVLGSQDVYLLRIAQ